MKALRKIISKSALRNNAMAAFFIVILTSCGNAKLVGTATTCETNTAQFIVTDGSITRVCGCAEPYGTFTTSNSFTCTVNVGTVLYFYFNGISNSHQVQVGILGITQSFNAASTTKVGAIIATQTGTFPLTDINTSIGGSLVVN